MRLPRPAVLLVALLALGSVAGPAGATPALDRSRTVDGWTVASPSSLGLRATAIERGAAGQETIGGLHITVRRNAFGRQVDSFEEDLHVDGLDDPVRAVFIRAPWVESVEADVEVLARVEDGPAAGRIVAVRQGPLLATSFHPEESDDMRIHRLFGDLVTSSPITS